MAFCGQAKRCLGCLNVAARAAAWVSPARYLQLRQCGGINTVALRLPLRWFIGMQLALFQLAQNVPIRPRGATWRIDVFYTYQPAPPMSLRIQPRSQCRYE